MNETLLTYFVLLAAWVPTFLSITWVERAFKENCFRLYPILEHFSQTFQFLRPQKLHKIVLRNLSNLCFTDRYDNIKNLYVSRAGIPFHHALFGSSPTEISLNALKHCRRRKARTVFSDPQLTGKYYALGTIFQFQSLVMSWLFILITRGFFWGLHYKRGFKSLSSKEI